MNVSINTDSTIARSMNDNINIDSTIAGTMNDNINMDSTIAGSMNDNIDMDSTIAESLNGILLMKLQKFAMFYYVCPFVLFCLALYCHVFFNFWL